MFCFIGLLLCVVFAANCWCCEFSLNYYYCCYYYYYYTSVVSDTVKTRNSNAVITITIRLRSDYDVSRAPASTQRDSMRAKNEHVNFSSLSCGSRIVVESQL